MKGAADRQWPANWRAVLRDHAKKVWRAQGKQPSLDKQAAELLDKALGPLADDALEIVEGYTLGARRAADQADPPAEFGSRLQIILNGVEASLGNRPWANKATGEAPPHVIQSELWQILRRVRESAELSYSREHDLIELDRRIVFLLQTAGPLVPADISGAVGVDKAQVSRSVKRLLKLGLAEREQIRAPLLLTKKGAGIAKRMLRRADLRNRELTIDISEDELNDFYETAEILLERSMALYEQERVLAQGPGRSGDAEGSAGRNGAKANEKIVIDRARIVSPLMTLSAYFSRSGALAFKRLTGLSNFEAFVLSEIGIAPPIEWAALVRALARDHSQAGRTVKALMDRGLVEREGGPGRRHGRFYPSPEGVRLHKVIHDAGRQRSDFLLAPLTIDRRARFLDIFAKLRRNAVAQLERERAFADFSRD